MYGLGESGPFKISLYAGTTQEAKSVRISTNGQSAGNLRKQRVLRDYTRDTCFFTDMGVSCQYENSTM